MREIIEEYGQAIAVILIGGAIVQVFWEVLKALSY